MSKETKTCEQCSESYARRKPSGHLYSRERWASSRFCSRWCHSEHKRKTSALSAEDRFWVRVEKQGADECWPYTSAYARKHKKPGLFYFSHPKKMMLAHRAAYTFAKGPIPDGLMVRHKCDYPPCCNPAHLLVGTAKDNTEDRVSRNRSHTLLRDESPSVKVKSKALLPFCRAYAARKISITGKTAYGEIARLAKQFGVTKHHVWFLAKQHEKLIEMVSK